MYICELIEKLQNIESILLRDIVYFDLLWGRDIGYPYPIKYYKKINAF